MNTKKYIVTWTEVLEHTSIIDLSNDQPPEIVMHEMSNDDLIPALRGGVQNTSASEFNIESAESKD